MKFNTLPNGGLQIVAEPDDAEMLADAKAFSGDDDLLFLSELLEQTGWTGNGRLFQVRPEQVGALTDAPMLTNQRDVLDDGTVNVVGDVWWYPGYEIHNFADRLLANGRVTFTLGAAALPCAAN